MADTTELYDVTKLAFIETLALAGVTISFLGSQKQCLARPIDRTSFPGESGGFVLEATTQVDMLDEDFDDWAGVDNLSLVDIDSLTLQILSIRRKPGNPVIHLTLKKDK